MDDLEAHLDVEKCTLCSTCTAQELDGVSPWKIEGTGKHLRIESTNPAAYREGNKIKLRLLSEKEFDMHYQSAYVCPEQAISLYRNGTAVETRDYSYYRSIDKKYSR